MPETRWLTEDQACQHTNRSVRALRLWRSKGDVQFSKQSGRTVYPVASLNACVDEQRRRYEARRCGRTKGSKNRQRVLDQTRTQSTLAKQERQQ